MNSQKELSHTPKPTNMNRNGVNVIVLFTLLSIIIIPRTVQAESESNGIDLDLIGIGLSIIIPIIAFIFGWYYSTRKRRILEKLISDMREINNPLDLYAWYESISSDGVLNGQINHAQMELLRGHYKSHQNRLENHRSIVVSTNNNSTFQSTQTNAISPEVADRIDTYVQSLVKDGYPEDYAREYALNNVDKF